MLTSKQTELKEYFEASPDSATKKDVGMQLLSNPRSVVSKIDKKLPASEQARKTRSSQRRSVVILKLKAKAPSRTACRKLMRSGSGAELRSERA
jgi:hypothetical protein